MSIRSTYDAARKRRTRTGYSGTSQTYDANGNLATSKVFSGTVSWDAEDRPIAIDFPGGKRVEYDYDAFGRRIVIRDKTSGVTQAEHRYIWDGNEIIEHRLATTGTVAQTIYCAQGERKMLGGTYLNYAYVRDQLGSVRMSVSDAGSVIEEQDYPPYGYGPDYQLAANASTSADFGYAGYFKDPVTSLWLTKYRVLGYAQWFSRDPMPGVELSQGPNLYAYVGNNPVNAVDPEGLYIIYGPMTNSFHENYNTQYNELRKTPTGNRMLDLMENSTQPYKINETNGGAYTAGGASNLNCKSTYQTLAHEFEHLITDITGDPDAIAPVSVPSDLNDYSAGSSEISEREATRMQNIVQREHMQTVPAQKPNADRYPGIRSYVYPSSSGGNKISVPYPFGR